MNFEVPYTPKPPQALFHASKSIYKDLWGALGSGKSTTLVVEAIALSLEYPGNVGLLARKSLPELQMTTQKNFFSMLPPSLILDYNQTRRELYVKTKGHKPSLIHFGPLDEIERYLSLELGWFGVDQAEEITEDMWLTLCGRLRLKGVRLSGMLANNPTTVNHWIYKKFFNNPKEGYELFRSKTEDNRENLPPGYIERLRSTYPPDWCRRYLDGEPGFIQEGDPVFPDFKFDLHVRPVQHTKGRTILRGWDFGYHRPCVVFAEIDELGRFKVLYTILGEDEDLKDVFAPRVIRYCNELWLGERFEDFCDIAGLAKKDRAKSAISDLNDLRVYPKYQYFLVEERNEEVRKFLRIGNERGEPKFQIDPKNNYLIEGLLGGYCYGEKKDGVLTDEPKKDGYYDHGMDALGYIIANKFLNASLNIIDREFEMEEPKWRVSPSGRDEPHFGYGRRD